MLSSNNRSRYRTLTWTCARRSKPILPGLLKPTMDFVFSTPKYYDKRDTYSLCVAG